MAAFHIVFVTTKVQNRKKNESYATFEKCKNARQFMYVDRMAGKVKEFVKANCLEDYSVGRDFNGYGYSTWIYGYLLTPSKAKELKAIIEGKKVERVKKAKTQDDIIKAWAKRLDKLTGIGVEEATEIAKEKLEYQREQVAELNERQARERYSKRRQSLINQVLRANPLRRIEGVDHAQAILSASHRHNNTCYEAALRHFREEAQMGNIDYDDVRPMAREAVRTDTLNL